MKKIGVVDSTFSKIKGLTFKERLTLVRSLASLGVDTIELGTLTDSSEDSIFVKTIAPFVANTEISAFAGETKESADAAVQALSAVKNKKLTLAYPTSAVQIEYFCHVKPAVIFEKIKEQAAYCASLGIKTEFAALDATRADSAFLKDVITAVEEAGVSEITLCDSEGIMSPDEISSFVSGIRAYAASENVKIGFSASDSLYMACANTLAAVKCGADFVKTDLVSGESVSLEALVKALSVKGNDMGICTGVESSSIHRSLAEMTFLYSEKSENALVVSSDDEDDDVLLAKGTTLAKLSDVIKSLGYVISKDDTAKVFEMFEKLAERKPVSGKELESVIASVADEVPPTYILRSYIVNTSDKTSPMAQVEIERDGKCRHGVSIGDGPIDAAFLAIEKVIGTHYELDDFRISSVSRGQEAMGEALVRLRFAGRVYSGTGASTDIIGASVKAYVAALNKIVFEER